MTALEAAYFLFFTGGVLCGLGVWVGPFIILLAIVYHKRIVLKAGSDQ